METHGKMLEYMTSICLISKRKDHMSEEIKDVAVENKVVDVLAEEKKEEKRFSITLNGPEEKAFIFSYPENSKVEDLEQAAYRILNEFVIYRWKNAEIENAKKVKPVEEETTVTK